MGAMVVKEMSLNAEDARELEELRQYARKRLSLWKKRAIYSGIAFFLSCASVYPFLYGHSLHSYWRFGKYMLFVSFALLYPLLHCTASLWASWTGLRELEKDGL
jgi:hypothetical protein